MKATESDRVCTVLGCVRPVWVLKRGLCSMHYQRFMKFQDPLVVTRKVHGNQFPCTVEVCKRRRYARGLCAYHFHRLLRRGDPLAERLKPDEYTPGEDAQLLALIAHTRNGVGRAKYGTVKDLADNIGRTRKSASRRLKILRHRRKVALGFFPK